MFLTSLCDNLHENVCVKLLEAAENLSQLSTKKYEKLAATLLVVYLLSTSSSCKKNSFKSQLNREFPTTIGTWWKYKVFDSVSYQTDTVTITVIGTAKLNNGDNAILLSIHSLIGGTDTNYVTSKSDGIRIYSNKLTSASPYKRYVFPIELGKSWITYNVLDTNKVIEKSAKTVLAGTFTEAYRIERTTRIPPGLYVVKEEEWFVPYVGMVYRYYSSYGTPGVEGKTWELVSYKIK